MVEDYNDDGLKDINDFFYEVTDGKWTFDRVAEYAAKAYKQGNGNTSGQAQINDQLGFVLGHNGLPAAGMVYTSSVSIIAKPWDAGNVEGTYHYPTENPELVALTEKLNWLFNQQGVKCVTNADATAVEEKTPLLGVRKQFTSGKILFGGVILVGSLEYEAYQNMKKGDKGGFGVVPVPTYKEGDDYLTQIHVVGRAGGIAFCTSKFVQCSAFLQYQSANSTEIKNHYYDYNLTYDTASGLDGNIEMLEYIRDNVRTSFDKLFEDAIGFNFDVKINENDRVHSRLQAEDYDYIGLFDAEYANAYPIKTDNLGKLIELFFTETGANALPA